MKVLNRKPLSVAIANALNIELPLSRRSGVFAGTLGQRDDMVDFPIHKTDVYRTALCTWELLPITVLRTYALLTSTFFSDDQLERLPDNALRITPDSLPSAFEQRMAAEAAEFTRVQKRGSKGYVVSYCLASGFFSTGEAFGLATHSGSLRPYSHESMLELKARFEARWPQFFDLTKPIDFTIPTAELFTNTRLCSVTDEDLSEIYNADLDGSATSGRDSDEVSIRDQISRGVASVRITMSAAAGSFSCHDPVDNKVVKPNTFDELPDITGTTYQSQNNIVQFIRQVIESRLASASIFVMIKIPRDVAEYITQSDYDNVRPQYLASFFKSNSDFYFKRDGSEALNYITPLAQIRDANAKSRVKPKRRTNDGNLMIDRRGRIYFIPEIDSIDFVESEVETEGTQPNGEWAGSDVLDPNVNNFTSAVGADNVERRVKRRKGANRIVYTDWLNSRFAYTDSFGNYRTIDVMSSRPVTATHLVPVLTGRIHERTDLLSLLEFVGSNMRKFGINVQMNELDVRGFADEDAVTSVVQNFNNGQIVAALNTLKDQWERVFVHGRLPNIDLPRDFVDLVQEDYRPGSGFIIDYISENSPIKPYRVFWKLLSEFYRKAMADIDVITKERSVPAALQFLGTASIVANYCGKKGEIDAQDMQLRQKFLEDVGDPRECVISGIPFVKELTLAPHQVKAWNMIKNSPETAVIDVAAGGGKTILALLDIADQLGKGMRRPLVACPNNLIKNYVIDALVAFKGRVNTVVISTATLRSWGEDKIRELVLGAPVNTIFLTSYEFLSGVGQIDTVSYGMSSIKINKNCEFLREFEFGGIWMDESQFLKNEHSQRSAGVARMIADIPYKRQMTGTYIQDNLGDVVSQFSLMNPQVFGTLEDFKERFGTDEKGRNAFAADAPRKVRKTMEQFSRVVTIKRREWMSLLPPQEEEFHSVVLTENQARLYDDLLAEVTANIQAMLDTNPKLKEMMDSKQDQADVQRALEAIFRLHTQRLERFLCAPQYDETGSVFLTEPEDRISPKAAEVHRICAQHLNDGIPGKVLIFTQSKDSARSIYETAPPEIKQMMVHYTAERQEEDAMQFETDPGKMFMVGVEKSMNTGKNFQFCSRLIRVETVWNWGTLEQGEARILRPNFKVEEFREAIYIDWVFVDGTIDVSKMARMFAKMMSTAKFYEPDDPRFQQLPDLDYIPLSIKSLQMKPTHEGELRDHFRGYQGYRTAERESYHDFLANPDNIIEPQTLEDGGILPGSAILKKVPYIPNISLYGMDDLGLVKYATYAHQDLSDDEPQEAEDDEAADRINMLGLDLEDEQEEIPQNEFDPTGLILHTEDGEGECVGVSMRTLYERKLVKGRWQYVKDESGKKKVRRDADGNPIRVQGDSVRVRGEDGRVRSYLKTEVFVVTKKTADSESIRAKMARLAGADVAKTVGPKKAKITVDQTGKGVKIDRKKGNGPLPNTDTEQNAAFEMFTFGYNDMFCIGVDGEDPDVPVAELKSQFGFVSIRPYYFAEVTTVQRLKQWYAKASDAFNISPKQAAAIEHMIEVWSRSKTMLHLINAANPVTLRDFFMTQKKPNAPGTIKPYVCVQGTNVFICFDALTHKNMSQIKTKTRVPGLTFDGPVEDDVLRFCRTKAEAKDLINSLTTQYTITNRKELVDKFNATRIMTPKTEERE